MLEKTTFQIEPSSHFKQKILRWANQFAVFILFDSNGYEQDSFSAFDFKIAIDAIDFCEPKEHCFEALRNFHKQSKSPVYGFLNYNLKNEIHHLFSKEEDVFDFPLLYFFKARYEIELRGNKLSINRNYPEAFEILEQIKSKEIKEVKPTKIVLQEKTSKEKHLSNVSNIKSKIEHGEFYELNYCCEFYADNVQIEPLLLFEKLNEKAKSPFSSLVKLNNKFILSSSPERFICKRGNKVIAQPIKGTMAKSNDDIENEQRVKALAENEKERAENIMIVDLMRNDLARSAEVGSVRVDELCKVYSFKTINQLISTISAELSSEKDVFDLLENAFPMGSMTGAPKHEVMKCIDQLEDFNRSIFSGSIGYIDENGDADFNVVIRTLLYDAKKNYLSARVGSAITFLSNAEEEYDELMTKIETIRNVLSH